MAWQDAEPFGTGVEYYGDTMAGCSALVDHVPVDVGPDEVDATDELSLPSGPQRIELLSTSLFCLDDEDFVERIVEVDVP